ncbi:MAG: hypothetical protein ACKO34_02765 [Vampirovibrionales bacterium]
MLVASDGQQILRFCGGFRPSDEGYWVSSGDGGRDTAKRLQFKLDPTSLFETHL